MTFQIVDWVVHPQHGVGQVVNLADREFEPGLIQRYYELSMPGDSTMWVRLDLEPSVLRKPADQSEIVHCREILAARPVPLSGDARSRQASLTTRLKQGTLSTFCEVVRDLYAHGEHRSLYGTIAGFYRVTKDVLCQEWAMVEGVTLPEAIQEVNSLLEKAGNQLKSDKLGPAGGNRQRAVRSNHRT